MPEDDQKSSDDNQSAVGAAAAPDAAGSTAAGGTDAFRPDAIAERVNRLGTESDVDRAAQHEEEKLYERRKSHKKGGGGLESAASKRLAKIGESKVKRPLAVLSGQASDADPLLRRAAQASSWIQEHQRAFGALVAVVLVGAAGFAGYTFWQDKRDGAASALLAQALADEYGHVTDKTDSDSDDGDLTKPLYPTFKSATERRDAALAEYRAVESKYSGTGAAILARLAEASLLLDGGDAKGALAAYRDVSASPLAKADAEVRGRALEGVGFAEESLAQSDASNQAEHRAHALAAYRRLAEIDADGFNELGKYHQARVLVAQGDKAQAIDLLKEVQKRISDPVGESQFSYLKFVVEDRLRELDPTAVPPKARADASGGKRVDMNDPQIQKLLEQLKQKGAVPRGGPPK